MYYRLKTALLFNYDVDTALDKALKDGVKSGLKSVTSYDSYYTTAVFNNGTRLTYWNANKYYAWIKSGGFEFPNGEKYHFDNARPTAKTMYMMKCALANFNYCH